MNSFVREKGIHALVILFLEGQLARTDVVEHLKRPLLDRGEEDDPEFISFIVNYLTKLYPADSLEEIQWAFDNNLFPEDMMRIEMVMQQLEKGEEEALKEL